MFRVNGRALQRRLPGRRTSYPLRSVAVLCPRLLLHLRLRARRGVDAAHVLRRHLEPRRRRRRPGRLVVRLHEPGDPTRRRPAVRRARQPPPHADRAARPAWPSATWPWRCSARRWPLLAAIGVSMCCSVFGQAGNGAIYAVVPLVKKRVSGQISGLVGAYGNIGGIVFLTALLFVPPRHVLPGHRRRRRGRHRASAAGWSSRPTASRPSWSPTPAAPPAPVAGAGGRSRRRPGAVPGARRPGLTPRRRRRPVTAPMTDLLDARSTSSSASSRS